MTPADDPNADLIGTIITIEGKPYTVKQTAPWSEQYVQLVNEEPYGTELLTRPAGLVRRHIALTELTQLSQDLPGGYK